MGNSISQQLFEFSVLLYGGIMAAFIYDFIALYQKHFKCGKMLSYFQDILYWFLMTSIAIYMLYYSSFGSVKGYSFFALILGYFFYKIFLGPIICRTIEKAFITIIKGIKIGFKILLRPFSNKHKN